MNHSVRVNSTSILDCVILNFLILHCSLYGYMSRRQMKHFKNSSSTEMRSREEFLKRAERKSVQGSACRPPTNISIQNYTFLVQTWLKIACSRCYKPKAFGFNELESQNVKTNFQSPPRAFEIEIAWRQEFYHPEHGIEGENRLSPPRIEITSFRSHKE